MEMEKQTIFSDKELTYPGLASCPACTSALSLRTALKALGNKTIVIMPASCSVPMTSLYPKTAVKVPMMFVAFTATASTAAGIAAALKMKGDNETNVLCWAGDGGTFDIGLQTLSGAAERKDPMVYVCYNNQGYMNTGTQRSGATPFGAFTTTTQTGKLVHEKDMQAIVAAHKIPYLATGSPSYPHDLFKKFTKAKDKEGFRYIEIFAPCPPGWGFPTDHTIKMGRLAVETGVHILYEIEDGVYKLSTPSKKVLERGRKEISVYVKAQRRFARMTEEQMSEYQRLIDEKWDNIMAHVEWTSAKSTT